MAKERRFRELRTWGVIGAGLGLRPAPYLPILEYDHDQDAGIVIKEGTVVAFDANGYIVPANGGVAQDLVYTALDVNDGVYDKATFTNDLVNNAKVASAKTVSDGLDANVPIGVVEHDVYAFRYFNDPSYKFQDGISVMTKFMAMWALDSAHAALSWETGKFVTVGTDGLPAPMGALSVDEGGTDTVDIKSALEQKIGRVVTVADASADKTWVGGMEYVYPVPGIGLPGYETDGANNGIDKDTKKAVIVMCEF